MKLITYLSHVTSFRTRLIAERNSHKTWISILTLCLIWNVLQAQTFPTPGFTLPAGKTIVITYEVDVNANACPSGTIPSNLNISNQGSILGSNFTTILTDDPDIVGVSNPTLTAFSALTIGNLVYQDNNRNGVFDAGDAGIDGVLLNLYLDNGDGILSAMDGAPLTNTSTAGGGLYSFTVCPGNYIVEVAASNFNTGGALFNGGNPLVSSPIGGAPDPDTDINNDDNGDPVAGFGVASAAITLAYGAEPTNDGDTDANTNLSLDFGFKSPTTVTINDVTLAEGTGGSTTAFNFTVTRNDNSEAFNLTVNTADGTAASTSDYTAIANGTASFTAGGSLTATVTVLINHDNMVEPAENFTVVLSGAPAGVTLTDATGLGTINNDDAAVVTLSGTQSLNEGNAGSTNFIFQATLNNPVQGGFTIAYNTNNGTATLTDADYVDNDNSINFVGTAGEVQNIIVAINGDVKVEVNETFTVSLGAISAAPSGVSAAGSPQTGTILNDDSAVVTLSVGGAGNMLNEGNAGTTNFVYNVTLNNPVQGGFTIAYTSDDGTATVADNDYINNDASLIFAGTAGEIQNITIQVNGDLKVEANETFTVNLGAITLAPAGVTSSGSPQSGTILNDDSATVTLTGGGAANEGNTGTTPRVFTATLNNPVQGGFSISYATTDGTATTADNDYTDNDGPALVFAGTANETQLITVLVTGDLKVEANETFTVTLGSISGAPAGVLVGGTAQTGTITNDEIDFGDAPDPTYPTLLASNGARHNTLFGFHLGATIDGDLNGQPSALANGDGADEDGVTLPSILVNGTTANIVVNATSTGLLNAWVDFNDNGSWAETGEQIFTNTPLVAGNNNLSFAVPPGAVVGTTFARFRFSSASGLSFNGLAADGEVEDYAIEIVNTQFSISDPVAVEGNTGTVNLVYTVSRNVNVNNCSVNYAVSGGTATVADSDFQSLIAGTLNFTAGGVFSQNITVIVNGDSKVELDETVHVSLSAPVDASILDGLGVGTILNDDAATITLNNPSIIEGDAGTSNLVFTIMINNPVDANVQVDAATLDGLATIANLDYVDFDETITILANTLSQTATVLINGDCTIEANENFSLELSNIAASGRNVVFSGGGASLQGTGTILNDDVLPQISCPAEDTYNTNLGTCDATIILDLPTVVTSCGTVILQFRYRSVNDLNVPTGPFTAYIPSSGNTITIAKNRYEVQWRITDGSGTSNCSQYIEIFDLENPSIICPSTQTLNLDGDCEAILPNYTGLATIDDNCGGNIVVQSAPAGTTVSQTGTVIITLTVSDENGNSNACTFNVSKIDAIPPVAVCQNDTVNFNGETTLLLIPGNLVVATDNCGVGTINATPSTVNINQIGQTIPVILSVTDLSSNSSTCVSQVTIGGLPAGWSQNVNGVNCQDGNNVEYEPSTQIWTMSSTGCFYGPPFTSDELGYAQYSICGNGQIVAQVTGISGSGLGWAGVSMRETTAAGSKKVQLTTNLSNFARREIRTVTGGASIPQQFLSPNRFWLKIVRTGNQFVGYTSPNGVQWYQVMAANVPMNACIQLGLVLTNYDSGGTVNATFTNVSTIGTPATITDIPSNLVQVPVYEYTVYPNPSNGEILVDLGTYARKEVRLELIDTYGRIVFTKEMDAATGIENIDISSFANGIYFLKARSPGIPDNIKKVILLKN